MGSEGRGGCSLGAEGCGGGGGLPFEKQTNKPERGSKKQLCFCVRGFMRSLCTRLPLTAGLLSWAGTGGAGAGRAYRDE